MDWKSCLLQRQCTVLLKFLNFCQVCQVAIGLNKEVKGIVEDGVFLLRNIFTDMDHTLQNTKGSDPNPLLVSVKR